MDEIKLPDDMRDVLRASWHRYLDQVQSLRPQLHAYCRRLTNDLWDAEDLAQDSLLKAFGLLGRIDNPIRNPGAVLFHRLPPCQRAAPRRRRGGGADAEPAEQ